MDQLNGASRVRQERFRENLRWYLKNQSSLQQRAEAKDGDSYRLVAAFGEASTVQSESKIDRFNEIAEQYRAANPAMNVVISRDNRRDVARA